MIQSQSIQRNNTMNDKQKLAFEKMYNGENVFITGIGGSGKTFLINKFVKLHKHKQNIAVTSTTGTSAILLNDGTTIHSWAGIGLGQKSAYILLKNIKSKKFYRDRWKTVDVLIIDEISMMTCELLEKLDYIAKNIRKNEKPFGGIQIIATGDFLQLPCVKSDQFCFESDVWKQTIKNTVYLTENMRQSEKEWIDCLNDIRIGNITPNVQKILKSRMNVKLENDVGIKPTILYPLNTDVDSINNYELEKLSDTNGNVYEYEKEFTIYPDKYDKIMCKKFEKNCNCAEKLQLTKHCQVMLIHNLDVEIGLVNGTRGVITGFTPTDLPIVKFLNGVVRPIDYNVWKYEEKDKVIATIEQIPLKLGYAFSIHKSQGCTIDYVVTDLSDIFTYGQAYVALSRVKSLDGLKIIGLDINKIKAHPKAVEFYASLEEK